MINTLMTVSFDDDNNTYSVMLGKGSSVSETAFSMAVVIKCLLKDKVIENSTDITTLIDKYLSDAQYDELKEDGNEIDK